MSNARLEELYKGLAADPYKVEKYGHAGIYSISIISTSGKEILVYIGKSRDMLKRLSNHIDETLFPSGTNKYKVLHEAREKGLEIKFDVIYDCPYGDMDEEQDDDLGRQEGIYIRKYLPPLNYQVPKEENWKCFNVNKDAKYITLDDILLL